MTLLALFVAMAVATVVPYAAMSQTTCPFDPSMEVQDCGIRVRATSFEVDRGEGGSPDSVDLFQLVSDLEQVQGDVDAITGSLSDVQRAFDASVQQLTASLSATDTQLKARISNLDNRQTQATSDLADRATAVETAVGELQQQTGAHTNALDSLTDELSALKVATEDGIKDAGDAVTALDDRVGELETDLVAQLSEVAARLSDTEKGIAECAATGQLYGGADEKSQSNPNGCIAVLQAGSNPFTAVQDCYTLKQENPSMPSGLYYINPGSSAPQDAFQAYCDMSTNGGGWTIIMATTGNDVRLTSNTETAGDPLDFKPYNLNRAKKKRIDDISSEIILVSSSDTWLRVASNFGFTNLDKANSESWTGTMVTSSSGQTDKTAAIGWANYKIANGGEFGIRNAPTFDRHDDNYLFLQDTCEGHYLYDYGPGYDVQTPLGAWKATQACDSAVGGDLSFYIGLRGPVFPGRSQTHPAKSCKDLLTLFNSQQRDVSIMNGKYWLKPTDTIDAFEAWCDFTTAGGGWTVIYSWDSTSANWPSLLADNDAGGNPLAHQNYVMSQLKKMAIDSVSGETLFKRTNGVWMRLSGSLRLELLRSGNRHMDLTATATASNGASSGVHYGWSNFNIGGGGDFGVKYGGFDHHSAAYFHLQSGCSGHLIYSYGSSTWRAGYDSSTTLGNWGPTAGCDSAPGGSLAFWAALR